MILFSDFDDTLFFREEPSKSEQNLSAIREWRAAGNQFCITTGRSYLSLTTEFPALKELCDFYILDSGSIIYDKNGKLLHTYHFPAQLVEKIVDSSKTLPEASVACYYTAGSEGFSYETKNITKLRFWFKNPDILDQFLEEMSAFPALAFKSITISRHKELEGCKGFIELIPLDSGKSQAIKFLAKHENLPLDDIVTVGNGLNDYGMIKDFSGYMIFGSELSEVYPSLQTTPSLATLIRTILNQPKASL